MNRYDNRARLVFYFAREESEALGHKQLEPEHLLLGLLREEGEASRVLTDKGVTLAGARRLTQEVITQTPKPRAKTTITLRTVAVMKLAGLEAERLGEDRIGTEHMLLALLDGEGGVSRRILTQLSDA